MSRSSLLLLMLAGFSVLSSCRQVAPKPSAGLTPSGQQAPSVQTTILFDLEAQQESLSGQPASTVSTSQTGKALDFELREEHGKVNPHLSHQQPATGVRFSIILVSTDPSQPVFFGTTYLFAQRTSLNGEVITGSQAFLRSPSGGGEVSIQGTPDFTKGKWRMALIHGGRIEGNKLIIDPNRLEDVKQTQYKDTDLGIDLVQGAGKHNLQGVSLGSGSTVSLDVPYFSQWVDLELGTEIIHRPGSGGPVHIQPKTRFRLKPQGVLLRLQLKNDGFADAIQLAGLRLLTNSLAFRGEYELSDAILGRGSAQKKDITKGWIPYSTRGKVYDPADSAGYRFPFPHFADFWLRSPEEIARGQYAPNYYLIWAMPIKVADKSRSGILHVLLYDKARTEERYNLAFAEAYTGDRVVPKALIRKPALTRSFEAGRFPLSDQHTPGAFLRLEGWQTPIYNALDFIEKEDVDGGAYVDDTFSGISIPAGRYAPSRADWARLLPTKTPDNQIGKYKYYYYSYSDDRYFANQAGAISHSYNSNKYWMKTNTADNWKIGRGANQNDLYLDEADLPAGITFTAYDGLSSAKVGRANNRVELNLPEAMLVPIVQGGQRIGYYQEDKPSHFSTYHYKALVEFFSMVGWGQGQTYLTGYYFSGSTVPSQGYGRGNKKNQLDIYGRYYGPAFHAVYPDGASNWKERWPWDITFYGLGKRNTFDDGTSEYDDTKRTFRYEGYQVRQPDGSYSRVQGEQDNSSTWMAAYWATGNEWFFVYRDPIRGNDAPAGFDKAQNAVGTPFTSGQVKARLRLFSKTPILPRR